MAVSAALNDDHLRRQCGWLSCLPCKPDCASFLRCVEVATALAAPSAFHHAGAGALTQILRLLR
jgi:hypothetical protein